LITYNQQTKKVKEMTTAYETKTVNT